MDIRSTLKRLFRFVTAVVGNTVNDQVFFRGTGLAFTTMLTAVPVIMVIFSFGGFDQLGMRILDGIGDFLLPDGDDALQDAFTTFTSNAGRLSTWGSILFLASAVMLLNAVENHLNVIFRARPHRSIAGRMGLYMASLLLLSFMFGSGFGPISGMMDAWYKVPSAWQRVLGIVLSVLGAMTGMIMLFSLLSAARIRIRSALVGSLVGALAFQAAKIGFTFWSTNSVRQSVIYGSVVFIPKLLIWLAVAWVIFLISAEITYAIQTGAGREKPFRQGSPADETELGWKLFLAIARDFRDGLKPPKIRNLAATLSTNESSLSDILLRLEDDGLVRIVSGHPPGYMPAADLEIMKAGDVLESITGWNRIADDEDPADASGHIRRGIESSLGDRSIRSFLDDENTVAPL